jgi:hypothetical protein
MHELGGAVGELINFWVKAAVNRDVLNIFLNLTCIQ